MWAVMMVAMMLPSAAPVVLLAAALDRQHGTNPGRSTLFAAGYLIVWFGFSLAVTALQYALDTAGLLSETMAIASRLFAAAVLIAAGIYQWTPLKQACLTRCRSPIHLPLRYLRRGEPRGGRGRDAARRVLPGLLLMLMALLFVGGLMNLAWI